MHYETFSLNKWGWNEKRVIYYFLFISLLVFSDFITDCIKGFVFKLGLSESAFFFKFKGLKKILQHSKKFKDKLLHAKCHIRIKITIHFLTGSKFCYDESAIAEAWLVSKWRNNFTYINSSIIGFQTLFLSNFLSVVNGLVVIKYLKQFLLVFPDVRHTSHQLIEYTFPQTTFHYFNFYVIR